MMPSRSVRLAALLALLALGAGRPARAQTAAAPGAASWLTADSAARTVTIVLEVAAPPSSPSAQINGYREGGVQVVVPLRWSVTWDWRSVDSTSPHSLVVMAEREKLPTEGGQPAFTNAMTRKLTGLPAGQADRTTFEADQPGWYWLLCGVPAHALRGEWIGLRVDPDAKTAIAVRRERRKSVNSEK